MGAQLLHQAWTAVQVQQVACPAERAVPSGLFNESKGGRCVKASGESYLRRMRG